MKYNVYLWFDNNLIKAISIPSLKNMFSRILEKKTVSGSKMQNMLLVIIFSRILISGSILTSTKYLWNKIIYLLCDGIMIAVIITP